MSEHKDKPPVEEIGCLEAINGLYAYLDGEMDDPAELARFEHHLTHCRVCCSRTDLEKALALGLQRAARSRSPAALQDRLRKLLDGL